MSALVPGAAGKAYRSDGLMRRSARSAALSKWRATSGPVSVVPVELRHRQHLPFRCASRRHTAGVWRCPLDDREYLQLDVVVAEMLEQAGVGATAPAPTARAGRQHGLGGAAGQCRRP